MSNALFSVISVFLSVQLTIGHSSLVPPLRVTDLETNTVEAFYDEAHLEEYAQSSAMLEVVDELRNSPNSIKPQNWADHITAHSDYTEPLYEEDQGKPTVVGVSLIEEKGYFLHNGPHIIYQEVLRHRDVPSNYEEAHYDPHENLLHEGKFVATAFGEVHSEVHKVRTTKHAKMEHELPTNYVQATYSHAEL